MITSGTSCIIAMSYEGGRNTHGSRDNCYLMTQRPLGGYPDNFVYRADCGTGGQCAGIAPGAWVLP